MVVVVQRGRRKQVHGEREGGRFYGGGGGDGIDREKE